MNTVLINTTTAKPKRLLLALSWTVVLTLSALAQSDNMLPIDEFFNSLVLGRVTQEKVVLEIPADEVFYGPSRVQDEWQHLWSLAALGHDPRNHRDSAFFSQAIRGVETPYVGDGFFYAGGRVHPSVLEWDFLVQAVRHHIGESLELRTAQASSSVEIAGYDIIYNGMSGYALLVAVGAQDPQIADESFIVASRQGLLLCQTSCRVTEHVPTNVLESIEGKVQAIAGIEDGSEIRLAVMSGSLTDPDATEYVVYVLAIPPDHQKPEWYSMVLSQELDLISLLGSNSYLRMIPTAVNDINGDGIDEIWVHLQGLEGYSDGVIYFRGWEQRKRFGLIRTALNGM